MNKKLLLTSAGLIFSLFVFSQSVLKGKVFNSSQQLLNGATVVCKNNATHETLSATTSDDGEFKFTNLAKGTYEIKVEFVGFISYDKQFKLDNDDKKEITVQLVELSNTLQNVNVFTSINGENETSSRSSEKNANNITNVISAQAMQRSPDINAANVLQRMSGVTLQKNSGSDEAYAIVRGLEPRYNNTLINGVKITSPDEKSRFVSLDIVPSELLQKIEVSKSLLPEMEGDAIGGTVNLVMKDAPDTSLFKATASLGYSIFSSTGSMLRFQNLIYKIKACMKDLVQIIQRSQMILAGQILISNNKAHYLPCLPALRGEKDLRIIN